MKKKILSFLIAICLVIPCAITLVACKDKEPKMETWDGTVAEVSAAVENVITIETAEELAGLAKEVKEGNSFAGTTIKLTCDMDLKEKEWTPIGFGSSGGTGIMEGDSKPFDGIFDGQNHTIYNLKITNFVGGAVEDTTASSGVGLFGHVRGVIKNITVEDAEVKGNHYVAAVVGFATGAEIDNCHAIDVEISCIYKNSDESGDKAGAVLGFIANSAYENSAVKNCTAKDSEVDADRDAGKVIGCVATNNYGTSTTATNTNNTAGNDVEVEYNETGKNVSAKSGYNITNDIVGREVVN